MNNRGPNYLRRWEEVWDAQDKQGMDSLVLHGVGAVSLFGNILYLTGHVPSNKGVFAVIRRGDAPELMAATALDALSMQQSGALATGTQIKTASVPTRAGLWQEIANAAGEGRIGFAGAGNNGLPNGDHRGIRQAFDKNTRVVDGSGTMEQLRRNSDQLKARQLRKSMRVAELAISAGEQALHTESTEREVAGAIAQQLRANGSLFEIVHVCSNDFRGQAPRERRILEGDIVTVFVETAAADGHWVELGAVFAIGHVSDPRLRLAHRTIDALGRAATHLHAEQPFEAVAEHMSRAGQPTIGFGHSTGIDEIPVAIAPGTQTKMLDGEAVALHPSLTDTASGDAAGVANTFLITPQGGTALSTYPSTLRQVPRTRAC